MPFAGLIVIGVVGASLWLFQAQIGGEVFASLQAAQMALPNAGERLGLPGLSDYVTQMFEQAASSGGVIGKVTAVGTTALAVLTNFFILVFGEVYLAMRLSHARHAGKPQRMAQRIAFGLCIPS